MTRKSKNKKAQLSILSALLVTMGLGGYVIVKKPNQYTKNFETKEHEVVKIIDGDTLSIKTQENKKIRLIGINAPEIDECFGKESKEALKNIIGNKKIKIEKDISGVDDYERLLRYVIVENAHPEEDNILVNHYMVRNGFARYTPSPPNNRYRDVLITAQNTAQTDGVGLWGECDLSDEEKALMEKNSKAKNEDCVIKGNVSEKGYGKTYLMPGCANYNRVKIDTKNGDSYFCSEEEALEAGFRKAINCS